MAVERNGPIHLQYALASDQRAHLVLCENDGSVVHVFNNAARSFRRIERDGEWWQLAGRDRATGELVYMREAG